MEWIPRSQNDLADFLSSICNTDDWGLSPLSCHLIDSVWEPNYKDRFANHANAILARCNSRNPGSEGIDAFVINWTRGKPMLGRPSALFFCVLLHMRNCKASGTLIFLLWHFVSIWPMICPGRNCFSELLVD